MKTLYVKSALYKKVKGRFFKNILFALLFLAVIPLTIVFLVTYNNYNKILSNQINNQYIYMIQQYNEDISNKIASLVNSTNNILLDEDVITFDTDVDNLYTSYYSFVNINNILTNELQLQYNWVTSIYLYYPKNNLFIANGYYRADNFYDTKILYLLNNLHINNFDNYFITRKIHYNDNYNGPKYLGDTLTVIRPIPFTKNKGFLVINIKGTIFNLIKGIDENFNGLFTVINDKNEILYTAGNMSFFGNIINTDIIRKVSDTYEQGAFSERHNFTVLYSGTNRYGFRTIMIAPKSIIFISLSFINKYMALIFLFILLLSFIISYYMSNKLYNPLYELLNSIRNGNKNEINTATNEFQYIQNKYKHILQENDEFSKQLQANIPILKELFLLDLLKGKIANSDNIHDKLNFLNIKLNSPLYVVFIILLDDCEINNNYRENILIQHLKYTINEILAKTLNTTNLETLYASTSDDIILIMGYDKTAKDHIDQVLKETAENIYASIKEQLDISISISIGLPVYDIFDLSHSYTTAKDAINYVGLYKERDNIIYANNITLPKKISNYYPTDKERNLILSIFNCNREKSKAIFNEMIDEVISKGISYEFFQQIAIQIVNTIMKSLMENNIKLFEQDNLYKKILEIKTAKNIKLFIEDLFNKIVNYLEKNRIDEKTALFNDILEYIHKNYSNNINLEVVADHFQMSRQYFSKIFTKYTGKNFNEYLNSIKLEKSLDYLVKSDYSIKEIAEKIGFSSSQYYIKLFKEKYNVTPVQYRKSLHISVISN